MRAMSVTINTWPRFRRRLPIHSSPSTALVVLRLWLDEMISTSVAQGLRRRGSDARAAQGTPETTELDHTEQLAEAVRQRRQRHYGIVLVGSKSIPQGNLGALTRSLDRPARDDPDEDSLIDQLAFLPAAPRR